MHRSIQLFVASVVLSLAGARTALAVNIAFMPGDAFFGAELTEALLDRIPDEGGSIEVAYNYRYRIEDATFGGYAGFEKLRIEDVPPGVVKNLQAVYRSLRKRRPKEIRIRIDDQGVRKEEEMNGFDLFIYNQGVDWSNHRLGVKYNEKWWKLPDDALTGQPRLDFGGATNAAERYMSYIPTYEAVVHDWKLGSEIPPLQVKVPENIAWGAAGPPIHQPVVATMEAVQFVVLESDDLLEYFNQAEWCDFYSITEDRVQLLSWNRRGKLMVKDWSVNEE